MSKNLVLLPVSVFLRDDDLRNEYYPIFGFTPKVHRHLVGKEEETSFFTMRRLRDR